jgi:hypothetical protein
MNTLRTRHVVCAIALLMVLVFCSKAKAQQFSSNELTAGVSSRTWGQYYTTTAGQQAFHHYLGSSIPAFTYDRNLSSTLAIEGSVEPWSQFFKNSYTESGHEIVALAGIKAGWRGARWGLYGKTRAGIASDSCGDWSFSPQPYSNCTRVTNFTMDYGGDATYRLSSRFALRFDASHRLSTELPKTYSGTTNEFRTGGTWQHFNAMIGLTTTFGVTHDPSGEHCPAAATWDAGFSLFLLPRAISGLPVFDWAPSPGIWASWNASSHISWDSTVLRSGPARNDGFDITYPQWGGRSVEALTGIKIGLRRDHMGYFAKLRGGTVTFGKTEKIATLLPDGSPSVARGMFTSPLLDAGGVWEVYPSHHILLRIDTGSITTFYQPKTVYDYSPVDGPEVGTKYNISGYRETDLLLGFGMGYRF